MYTKPYVIWKPLIGILANREDPDEMQHDAAFHQGLYCLQILKQPPGTDIQVKDKGFFSKTFLFKPRGGRSPPSGLNRKPRKNPLFSL